MLYNHLRQFRLDAIRMHLRQFRLDAIQSSKTVSTYPDRARAFLPFDRCPGNGRQEKRGWEGGGGRE